MEQVQCLNFHRKFRFRKLFLVARFYLNLRIELKKLQNNVVFLERQKNSPKKQVRAKSVFQSKFFKLCKNNSFAKEQGVCAVIHRSEVIVLVRIFVHAEIL